MSAADRKRKREAIYGRISRAITSRLPQFSNEAIEYLEARARGEVWMCREWRTRHGWVKDYGGTK